MKVESSCAKANLTFIINSNTRIIRIRRMTNGVLLILFLNIGAEQAAKANEKSLYD